MTDKQIIIDGIDVSGCCYFDYENDGYEDSCYIHQNECSAQNCYYKQLKRSEAQCEAMFVTHTDLEKKYKSKEQECERLKEANEHIEHNRTQKANKLKRIEEVIIACESGYTDEFIQSILAIILEAEPIKE